MTNPTRILPLALLVCACLLGGCRSYLAFATATTFGLDASQRADQTVDITMGYKRLEVASIPVLEEDDEQEPAPAGDPVDGDPAAVAKTTTPDASATHDAYSVLGSFQVVYGNPFTEGLVLKQLFATGMVARDVAENEDMQKMFGAMAAKVITEKGEE